MSDLGIKRSDLYPDPMPAPPPADKAEDPIVFPTLTLEPPQAKAGGLEGCEFGDEYTATVRLKVSRVGSYSDSNPKPEISLSVLSMDDVKEVSKEAEADEKKPKERLASKLGFQPAKKKTISPKETTIK